MCQNMKEKEEPRDYPLKLSIRERIEETTSVVSLWLGRPDRVLEPEASRYQSFFDSLKPGHFLMVWLPQTPDKEKDQSALDSIPLGVAGVDKTGQQLLITVQMVGPTTTMLSQYKPGDSLGVLGPLGRPFTLPEPEDPGRVVLVGGGVGLAPLRFLRETLVEQEGDLGNNSKLLYGMKTRKEFLYRKELSDAKGVELFTDDGTLGTQGFPTDRLARLLETEDISQIFFCGPEPMMKAGYNVIERFFNGLRDSSSLSVEYSLETRFYCGVGVCGLCSHEKDPCGKLVCRDGPVFSHHEVGFLK